MNFFNPKTELQKVQSYKNFKKNFPGTVVIFVNKPSTKNYYDSLPIVLGVRLIGTKMFGVNLKLIPYRDRMRMLNLMMELKYENEPRVAINKLLKGRYARIIAACFEMYDIKNIKSKIKALNEQEWAEFALADYNSFKNIPKGKIYKIVKEKIKTIKAPLKYIIQIIKNNIKRKK
jgi:hypothetical protein